MRTYNRSEMDLEVKAARGLRHGVFTARHYKHDEKTGLMLRNPYLVVRKRNAFVNVGGALLLNLLAGAGGTAFDNTHAYMGAGDSNSATTSGMTDLQGTLASTVNISSSTNASPIVLTTSGAHGYSAGDTITVAGHTTNTAANGTWVITVPSGTTIGLVGSTGSGVGGATGTTAKGNRFRAPMASTFPSLSSQTMTWEAAFTSGQAEWGTGILEVALFNGPVAASSVMLARSIGSFGVKTPGTTIRLDYTIHCP